VSTTPQNAVRLWDAFGALDVVADLSRVAVPTLVVHCRDDALVSFKLGAQLASAIPGARFLPLDSRNHLLLADEPAWQRLLPELTAFLAEDGGP
jgi:pimeloyl-ACP methyl ester carboxylesterase